MKNKTMRTPFRTPFAAVLLAAGLVAGQHAWADTTFTLDSVQDVAGNSYTGSFDFLSGHVYDVAITMTSPSVPGETVTFSGSPTDYFCTLCSPTNQYDEFGFSTTDTSQTAFNLYLDVADPLNLGGSNPLIPDTTQSDQYSDLVFFPNSPPAETSLQNNLQSEGPIVLGLTQGSLDASPVPEPATLALFAMGLVCLGFAVARRSRRTSRA